MDEKQKPHLRWSGIVGEAPKPATPMGSEPATLSPPAPAEAAPFKQALEQGDIAPILNSPNVSEDVKTAASWFKIALTWIAAVVLLIFGGAACLISLHLVLKYLIPLLGHTLAADFESVGLSVLGVVAGIVGAKFLYDGWQTFRQQDIRCARSLGWLLAMFIEIAD